MMRDVLPSVRSAAVEVPPVVLLPVGEFIMGENDGDRFANDTERPAHRVRISAVFAIGHFPVTNSEFRCFHPHHCAGEPGDLPVVGVSWCDACAYCDWLTEETGVIHRLPTEAEWEFACRAGSQAPFSSGDELSSTAANFLYDELGSRVGPGRRTPRGTYAANGFGLCDLHGNVCEWVADSWHANYHGAPSDGSVWENGGDLRRVIRGGAWDYLPRLLRSAWRDWRAPDFRADNLGFRVATKGQPRIIQRSRTTTRTRTRTINRRARL